MTTDQVNAVIDCFNQIQGQLVQLVAALTDQNKLAEATKVTTQSDDLTKTIELLQSQALSQWSQEAGTLITQISGLSDDLQKQIDSISQDISLGQNVVKALSIADEVLTKAKGLLTG